MARVHRQRIRLWRACDQLFDQLVACHAALRLQEPELSRALPAAGVRLLRHLRADHRPRAERALDRLDDDLALAVRRCGLLPPLLGASRAVAIVRRRLWVPEERDGAPTINRAPPDFDTLAAPLEVS